MSRADYEEERQQELSVEPGGMFIVKDSGKREEFSSGMVRDTSENKTLWHLVGDGPMLKRWAIHLTSGAKKYVARNWMKASGEAEYERFRESAFRHFMQWYNGDRDEDHGAAVFFNINGAEYVRGKLEEGKEEHYEGYEADCQRIEKAHRIKDAIERDRKRPFYQGASCTSR